MCWRVRLVSLLHGVPWQRNVAAGLSPSRIHSGEIASYCCGIPACMVRVRSVTSKDSAQFPSLEFLGPFQPSRFEGWNGARNAQQHTHPGEEGSHSAVSLRWLFRGFCSWVEYVREVKAWSFCHRL